jgi:hypothetical protein
VREKTRRKADAPKPGGGGGSVKVSDEDPLSGLDGDDERKTQEKMVAPVAKATARLGNASTPDAKKVIAQQLGSLKACWQRALEGGASGGGQFAVSLTVDAEGKVTDVDSKADAAVERSSAWRAASRGGSRR